MFGVIHDPDYESIYWTNLTSWSRSRLEEPGGAHRDNVRLEPDPGVAARTSSGAPVPASGPPALLGVADDDEEQQIRALYDAFALGRRDPRPLLLIRQYLMTLSARALADAVRILNLALVTGHGDIYWHPGDWIDGRVRARVSQELSDWTLPEVTRLLALPEPEEWSSAATWPRCGGTDWLRLGPGRRASTGSVE